MLRVEPDKASMESLLMERAVRDAETGCLRWTGPKGPKGYGRMSFKGKSASVHRVAHEVWIGPIPATYEVDHVYAKGCRHRDCIEPEHLEAVTKEENLRRRVVSEFRQHHCFRGHKFTPENTILRKRGRECRQCKELMTEQMREKFLDQCPYCPRTTRVGNMQRHVRRMHRAIPQAEWPDRFEKVIKTEPAAIGQPPRITRKMN